jgi:glycyl-tRNA synthetase beta chain
MASDVLLEIGVEELPASFVKDAVDALPSALKSSLDELRLSHGDVRAAGTPRRLSVWALDVADRQPDLREEAIGPPARVAFDAERRPTRAAEAFAAKAGVPLEALYVKATPKGEYVAAERAQTGAESIALLPQALERICKSIPFKKSMRWSDGDVAFGRPVRWVVALFDGRELPVTFAGNRAGRTTYGHRFLSPGPVEIKAPADYIGVLRDRHVLVDISERTAAMLERLRAAADKLGGELIVDPFLVAENASLVEEPHVVVGSFEPSFLALPERVILAVAKGHQRYFGVRSKEGALLPNYLAVVNTAERPDNVRRGNDRVMRARLSDAKFFWDEDLRTPLSARKLALDGIVFHKRLGTVGDKVRRIEALVGKLGAVLELDGATVSAALEGAGLSKCDLVTLMVGELPELQGEMGRAYALAQGTRADVADVIAEHYLPRGADDTCAASTAGALVAIADRLDTLTGSCAINVMPTGTADPLALRRAAIGLLRTLLERGWDLSVPVAVKAAHLGYSQPGPGQMPRPLDLDGDATADRLQGFLAQRLRGVLSSELPSDVVDACIAASAERPLDVTRRARALSAIDAEVRTAAGEVMKRAANIAKEAPDGEPIAPDQVGAQVHASEQAVFDALAALRKTLAESQKTSDHARSLGAIANFAPILGKFFEDVFVMVDDTKVRENRLRLMRQIHRTCSTIANFNLLAKST